jgi:long-chain acyl-CoA synthetase
MQKVWLEQYPAGVPASVVGGADPVPPTLVALIDESLRRHAAQVACRFMGSSIGFQRVDDDARALAAWLQAQGIGRGDRVAIMLPNLPQYLVAAVAVLRAGAVVVNINPLYTARELEHHLKDSGAKAIVLIESAAAALQQVVGRLPLRHVVLASLGDMLGWPRRWLVNHRWRRVKTQVPAFSLPGARRFADVLARGRRLGFQAPVLAPDDVAVLQYTGGTTGVSKGAVLLHRNLVANLLQAEAWYRPALARIPAGEQLATVAALPLHHIFGFNTVMLLGLRLGGCSILIPDARDIDALVAELSSQRFHNFPAVNTLFDALAGHAQAEQIDWRSLVLSVGGGMAVTPDTARRWLALTGCPVCQGYGLTEASPALSCQPVDSPAFDGSIGLPLPDTEVVLLDDEGQVLGAGSVGEIAVRGPQVTAGYWQRPDETAKAMTHDGFFRTGDIGSMDALGRLRLLDRKKDMILVSGFNVYPNEVEEVLRQLPGVLDCAAVALPDARAGEVVKVVIVKRDAALTEAEVSAHCEQQLTGYKRPRVIEFRHALPKNALGKVLRRELRGANGAG